MLFDNRILKRWSDVLTLAQRIMMAEPNEVIDVSPTQLLFGNSIQLDRGIFLSIFLSDWADKMFHISIAVVHRRRSDSILLLLLLLLDDASHF